MCLTRLFFSGNTHTLDALVHTMLANTADGGGSVGTCHLPCAVAGCAPLEAAALCGNGFLDAGEQCDNPRAGSGCYATNCTLKAGFTCPVNQPACLSPCVAHTYAVTGEAFCAADCLALTPRAGFTIDAQCVETDIDECALNTDTCDATQGECSNTPGAYVCRCFNGYLGDGQVCKETAYAVYTVVDIASIPTGTLSSADSITAALIDGLRLAYAQSLSGAIPSGLLTSGTFPTANAAQLAAVFTSFSLDPTRAASAPARLELVSLFETTVLANDVAAGVSVAAMEIALSQALFGTSSGVRVVQAPKTRLHSAASFSTPIIQGGWGMNVTSVSYNRTCRLEAAQVDGWSVQPAGGCWQVEMLFMGGQGFVRSDESSVALQQAKNVLYLPRIERDPATLAALVPAQTLTMSSGVYFPCDVTASSIGGKGIAPAATACCLRAFEASYRPSATIRPRRRACAPSAGRRSTTPFRCPTWCLTCPRGAGPTTSSWGTSRACPAARCASSRPLTSRPAPTACCWSSRRATCASTPRWRRGSRAWTTA